VSEAQCRAGRCGGAAQQIGQCAEQLERVGLVKVKGKGAKERIVPVGGTARTAIVRYG
jgi:site-specific recombinase XerC